jgi:hypothetical protein
MLCFAPVACFAISCLAASICALVSAFTSAIIRCRLSATSRRSDSRR